jgi:uncharacterized C2H2 Zn-finger protein
LGSQTLSIQFQRVQKQSPRNVPGALADPQRIEKDFKLAIDICKKFDKDYSVEGYEQVLQYFDSKATTSAPLENESDNLPVTNSTVQKLDALILYLNLVHFYDYYTGLQSHSPEDHQRRCSLPLRAKNAFPSPAYCNRIDTRHLLITGDEAVCSAHGRHDYTVELEKQITNYTRQEAESKFRCTECQKLFKGNEFVRKHVKTKHWNLVEGVEKEVEYFNNFWGDFGKAEVRKPMGWGQGERGERDRGVYGNSSGGKRRRPENRQSDPRGLRSYRDLDIPAGGDVILSYD